MNESLGTSSFRTTMDKAQFIQNKYVEWNCSHTQNIRNPIPMYRIVLAILPKLVSHTKIVKLPIIPVKTTIETYGKKLIHTSPSSFQIPLYEIFKISGSDYWNEKVMSFEQIVKTIKDKGCIVNSVFTVKKAIKYLLKLRLIEKFVFQKIEGENACFLHKFEDVFEDRYYIPLEEEFDFVNSNLN